MTLGTRLANVFLPTQSSNLVPNDANTHISFGEPPHDANSRAYETTARGYMEVSTAQEEEESRPPYHHVRPSSFPRSV